MSTLLTERLALLPPAAVQPAAVADFLARNTAHFARWDPPRPAGLATEAFQRESLPKQEREFAEGSCYRWYLVSHAEPTRVIGKLELSGVARGHSAAPDFTVRLCRWQWRLRGLRPRGARRCRLSGA